MALHEVQLKGYSVRPGNLSLGTFDSYGIEELHVTADDSWDGLAIVATFNPPEGDAVEVRVPADGTVDVPPEATTYEGKGTIVFCGVDSGVQRITKTMGYVVITHANVGTNTAFTPSEDLAAQVLNAALSAERSSTEANTAAQGAQKAAENAASTAQASAESASKAAAEAAAAKPYAESAKASAEAARNSENQAQQSSTEATAAKNAAQNAQAGAESSAAAAAKSAKEAAVSAVNLDNAANTATQKAAAASASATAAKASENAVANSEAAAKTYAESARTAKNSAAASAETANAAKDSASVSARDAAVSKTAAAASEKNAAKSENSAADSAAAAKKSAEDADNTANSIKDSMAQISENKEAVSQLKEDTAALKKRQNVLVGNETGNPVSCNDAYSAPLCGLTVYGKSTQDGTPTPDAPVPIVSAGDGGSVAVKVTEEYLLFQCFHQFLLVLIRYKITALGICADGKGILYFIGQHLISHAVPERFSVLISCPSGLCVTARLCIRLVGDRCACCLGKFCIDGSLSFQSLDLFSEIYDICFHLVISGCILCGYKSFLRSLGIKECLCSIPGLCSLFS